ncbi:MAG TPA: chorismate mutase [Thermoanaerobaculia bacterium]|nr:chorismate mutase [Thermoanaerobaculia bacterium]
MSLPSLRRKIDRIDDEIIGLLGERMTLALRTAEFKTAVRDAAREKAIVSRLQARAAASNRISPEFVAALYELIFDESRKAQQALISKEG